MNAPRLALLLAPVLLVFPHAACSSAGPTAPDPAHADVIFQGTATDAALTAMLAARPIDDPVHAAYFDNPKDLSELPGTPIITFTWHDGQAAALRLLPPPAKPTFTGILADLLGERTAHAGPPAMSGKGYLLAFGNLDTGQPSSGCSPPRPRTRRTRPPGPSWRPGRGARSR